MRLSFYPLLALSYINAALPKTTQTLSNKHLQTNALNEIKTDTSGNTFSLPKVNIPTLNIKGLHTTQLPSGFSFCCSVGTQPRAAARGQ